MLKKIVLASSILALTTGIALANTAPYIGASTGITVNTASTKFEGMYSHVHTFDSSYRGMPFNLYAGYGGTINQNFYLAGELFGTPGTVTLNNHDEMLKTSYGYGASILPGLMLSDHTMAYGRAGVVRSRFSDDHKTRTGGQFGLGMQTSLTQCIDVRGEYDYVFYSKIHNNLNGFKIASTKPRSDQFSVGVVYKFD